MIYLILYVVIGIVVAFFRYKKAQDRLASRPAHGIWGRDNVMDDPDTALGIIIPAIAWPFALPGIWLWKLLDHLYNKFNKPNQEQ